MNSKLVRNQLIAFVVVTVLGIGYAMASYVGLPALMGFGTYKVSVGLPSAGGIYANAAVTERGVTVGKVDDIRLTKQGVVADLSLKNGTKIPQNVHAAVANTSAIGEQFMELTPQSQGGPYLTAGSVVPASKVSLPPDPTTLLADLNTLLKSVPRQQLQVTVNELYNSFNGTGSDLRNLLDSSSNLLNSASQNIGPTKALINQSDPVLATQAANDANIQAFSKNLNEFTTQLRSSNSDLTGTLDKSPGTLSQVDDMIGQLQPTVPLLLSNLTATGEVSKVYLNNLQQSLVVFPTDINDLTSAIFAAPPGEVNVNFKVQADNVCTTGYPKTKMRQPSDTSYVAAPANDPYCTEGSTGTRNVRGAHSDPCPNNPSVRSATAAGCGLSFGTGGAAGESGSSASSSAGTAGYSTGSGLFVGPNGSLYSLGGNSMSGLGPKTLSGLLQETLG